MALLLGHRISVDFDLFSDNPIKKTLLGKVEGVFEKFPRQIILNNSSELTIMLGNKKITFFHYTFKKVLSLETGEPIEILSAKEILTTKAYSIGRRGVYKDYVDLYVGLKENIVSLSEIIKLAGEKYGTNFFNDRLFLEQLLYLDDIEEVEIIMKDRIRPTKKELLDFFAEKISEIKI